VSPGKRRIRHGLPDFVEGSFWSAQRDRLPSRASQAGAKGCEEYRSPNACPSRRAFADKLNFSGGVRHRAVLLVCSRRRQNNVREHRGFGEEQICTTSSSSLPSRFCVDCKCLYRVRADNVKRAQFSWAAAAAFRARPIRAYLEFSRPKLAELVACPPSETGHIREAGAATNPYRKPRASSRNPQAPCNASAGREEPNFTSRGSPHRSAPPQRR